MKIEGNSISMYGEPFFDATNLFGVLLIKTENNNKTVHFFNDKLISLTKLKKNGKLSDAELDLPETCGSHLLTDVSNTLKPKLYYADALENDGNIDKYAFEVSNKKILSEREQITLYIELERKNKNPQYANLLMIVKNDTTEATPEICITTIIDFNYHKKRI